MGNCLFTPPPHRVDLTVDEDHYDDVLDQVLEQIRDQIAINRAQRLDIRFRAMRTPR